MGLVGARERPKLRALVDRECRAEHITTVAPQDLPDRLDALVSKRAAGRGDNWPFEYAGIPTLFFGAGESDDYHTPGDTLDRIDSDLLERRARAIDRVIVALSRAPDDVFAYRSSEQPRERYPSGWYAPVGIGGGVSLRSGSRASGYVSAELSLVHLHNARYFWLGAYADGLRDLGAGRTRWSFGPEIGAGPFGIDAGLIFEAVPSGVRQGYALRPTLALPPLVLSARFARLSDADTSERVGEIGVSFKVPLGLGGAAR